MDSWNSGSLSAEGLHALLAATLESSPDFVGLSDSEGRVIFVNAAGRRLAGLAADADLTGLSASALHPPEVLALLLADAIPVAVATGHWEGE